MGTQQSLAKRNEINIKIRNESIPQATKSKYLGMQVENTMRWNALIDQLVNKLSSKIGILRRPRHIVPPATLVQLYNAIVVPHFDYGDIVYKLCTQNNLDRLQKMQKQASRTISGSSYHTHCNDMYADLNWLSLKNRRLMHKCIIAYKCLNEMAPQYLNDNITCNDNVDIYCMRSSKD